jgi:gamma-glutamyltranspeptidase/glutathione hydrolase
MRVSFLKPIALVLLVISVSANSQTRSIDSESTQEDLWSHGFMAAVANPRATEAAAQMLSLGGHAVDAAIAAHAVLGLLEPESSGLGGGGFMLVFERSDREVRFFDGREAAPSGARADMFMNNGTSMGYFDANQSGNAVGVPSTIALYKSTYPP